MTDLAAWLLEQIAEDEQVAEAASVWADEGARREWSWHLVSRYPAGGVGYQVVPGAPEPARVLAECDAKRRIVAYQVGSWDGLPNQARYVQQDLVLRMLALPYADRPGYDETWRP